MKVKLTLSFLIASSILFAQPRQTENLIIITLDGFRWQELFTGADSSILFNSSTIDSATLKAYWHASQLERRKKLLPFIWEVLGTQGQLYGNREFNNDVNCANPHWFSYPGYSELFTGFVDRRVDSNKKIVNPHSTVLEFIHNIPEYHGKIAAFSTWDVIPYIIRADKVGIVTHYGENITSHDSLNTTVKFFGVFHQNMSTKGAGADASTFHNAFEYLKNERPRVLYISLDETDQHAHGGRYSDYLISANKTDSMIRQLWEWLESEPNYRSKTTMILTTDHGRGKGAKNAWKNHGRLTFGSSQLWMAVIGPDTAPLGEMKNKAQYFQKQLAKTMTSFLGLTYYNQAAPVGEIIESMLIPAEALTIR